MIYCMIFRRMALSVIAHPSRPYMFSIDLAATLKMSIKL